MAPRRNTLTHCLNCSSTLGENDSFCPSCGQKTHDGKLPVLQVVRDFFTNEFNFDSKFFTSFSALFIPGKLTSNYFLGKRKTHLNPIRFFFFVLVLSLAWASQSGGNEETAPIINFGDFPEYPTTERYYFEVIDTLKGIFQEQEIEQADSIILSLRKKLSINKDSIHVFGGEELISELFDLDPDLSPKISRKEFVSIPPSEILEKRQITGLAAAYYRQKIKLFRDTQELNKFIYKNLAWMILSFIPLVALFLKLIYLRRKRFFIEHLVFSMHTHTTYVVFLVIGSVIDRLLNLDGGGILFANMWFSLYLYLSLKKYYSQSHWKTLLKFLISLFFYSILLLLFVLVAAFVSLVLF